MRTAIALSVLLLAAAAFAEDTKPPVISEVKSSIRGGTVTVEARITDETGVLSAIVHHRDKGGRVEDSPMVKNDYDDVFKTSFPGGSDTEYWIESSDLLGNGPALYGSPSRPVAASSKPARGGTTVAQRETTPPPQEEKSAQPPRERRRREARHPKEEQAQTEQPQQPPPQETRPPPQETRPPPEERTVAKVAALPVIEHRKPSAQPPEGRDFTVRVKIHSESPVAAAVLQSKQAGASSFTNTQLTHTEGDSYEATISGEQAKGTLEYFIAARNQGGISRKGDSEDNKTPYMITFKSSATPVAPTVAAAPAGPFGFTHNPLFRVLPNKPILVRAQVVPTDADGQLPDRVAVLFRGNDAQDQIVDMAPDANGGYGGFKAELPPQDEGAVFYQVVACDGGATKCGVDTGSKRKWHAAAVAAQPGGAQPLPLDAVSQKAPPSLPE